MAFSSRTARAINVALGVATVAGTLGHTARVLAGPTLTSLINLSNSADITVNNVAGQSFSVNGIIGSAITPFGADAALTLINTGLVTLSVTATNVLGLNNLLGTGAGTFDTINGNVSNGVLSGVVQLGGLSAVAIASLTGAVSTIGASIENTVFGVSNVRASSAFTNQVTTSLTAF